MRGRKRMQVCCLCGKMLVDGGHLCTAEVVTLLMKDQAALA